jgi:hypothetical protein
VHKHFAFFKKYHNIYLKLFQHILMGDIMTARESRKGASRYKVTNWKEYDASLVQRGNIAFWISEDAISKWHPSPERNRQGGQTKYSDIAIQTCLVMRSVYKLPLRQTEGFVNSLIKLLELDISSPDHTTISRRSEDLEVISKSLKKEVPITILIDSTGLKISGSGEWEEEKHGKGRKKQWRKLHLAIDEETLEIVATTLTSNRVSDPSKIMPLINQTESEINTIKADGAYDNDPLRKKLDNLNIDSIFPPRSDAVLSQNYQHNPTSRDKAIERIKKDGREIWEYASGYSKRNLVENSMFRYKNIIGSTLRSKTFTRQETEVNIGISIF